MLTAICLLKSVSTYQRRKAIFCWIGFLRGKGNQRSGFVPETG